MSKNPLKNAKVKALTLPLRNDHPLMPDDHSQMWIKRAREVAAGKKK